MAGNRHGQGSVYFKAEGYLEVEKLLYKGSFKNNYFHGHGTLYWPGQGYIYDALNKTGSLLQAALQISTSRRDGDSSVHWSIQAGLQKRSRNRVWQ